MPNDILTREAIESRLTTKWLGRPVTAFDAIVSTNTWLAEQAAGGAPQGALAVADVQTAGRGRMGRTWQSPPGGGLLFSLLFRPAPPVTPGQVGLVVAAGVAAVLGGPPPSPPSTGGSETASPASLGGSETASPASVGGSETASPRSAGGSETASRASLGGSETAPPRSAGGSETASRASLGGMTELPPQAGGWGGLDARLKWPNDVLIDGKKVAGLLGDASYRDGRAEWVVVGLGLNVNLAPADFPEPPPGGVAPTSLLAELGHPVDRAALLAALLAAIEPRYEALVAGQPQVGEWRRLSATLGQSVRVTGGVSVEGVAVDIAEDGSLLVKQADGSVVTVAAGDVSLRPR